MAATRFLYDGSDLIAEYDTSGSLQRRFVHCRDQTLTFSHNPTGQIASRTVTNAGYAWAGHVNVNEVTTVDGLNQIATEAGVSFGYDARGLPIWQLFRPPKALSSASIQILRNIRGSNLKTQAIPIAIS